MERELEREERDLGAKKQAIADLETRHAQRLGELAKEHAVSIEAVRSEAHKYAVERLKIYHGTLSLPYDVCV